MPQHDELPITPSPGTRRDFLRRLAGAGAILGGSGALAALLHDREPAPASARLPRLANYSVPLPAGSPRLAIARGQDVPALLRAAIDKMGGIARFISRGDVVLLKPNAGFDRPPAIGATTSPEVVAAMVSLCREAGARRIIVTDNPINSPEGSFFKSRIRRAVEENGGEVFLPRAEHFREIEIGGKALRQWDFLYKPFDGVTKVIGLPTAKSHNLSGASLSMKNWYGLLGGGRNRFHQSIDTVIADLGAMMTPTLVVLDATRLLMDNGPTGGSLADVKPGNTIVAGVDQVAIDTFGFTLLKRDPASAPYLALAQQRGIGTMDWRSVAAPEIQV